MIWVLVSVFLSLTAIFFAAMLGTNTEARLRWLLRGYIAAAVVASLLAIAGYFRLFGGCPTCSCVYSRATRHVQGPERVRGVPGAARRCSCSSACSPAAAREVLGGGLLLLIADGRPVPVVLARRLGPVRVLRDAADGAHLRDQPLAERALPHRRWWRSWALLVAAAFVAVLLSVDQVADAVRGARVADAELRHRPHRTLRPLLPGDLR